MNEPTLNPVIDSSLWAYKATDVVKLDEDSLKDAAKYIHAMMLAEGYNPRTWRANALHMLPPEADEFSWDDPRTTASLNWIFLVSSLNFSFWSEKCSSERYGVQWREPWTSGEKDGERVQVFTGYCSLLAVINRALEEDIPFTDPEFYSTCPDGVVDYIFRSAPGRTEMISLLKERIAIMRENGRILVKNYGGSFANFVRELQQEKPNLTALDVVLKVIEVFPSFRDITTYEGREVYFLKRAQILVAEIWAAFFPEPSTTNQIPHPIFPGGGIHQLTMFADYRVPQILHHLKILKYPPSLLSLLESGHDFEHGSKEEVSIRAASIVAVERVRDEILSLRHQNKETAGAATVGWDSGLDVPICSVLIDFYLWDAAKRIEDNGEETVVQLHRTRSIWY